MAILCASRVSLGRKNQKLIVNWWCYLTSYLVKLWWLIRETELCLVCHWTTLLELKLWVDVWNLQTHPFGSCLWETTPTIWLCNSEGILSHNRMWLRGLWICEAQSLIFWRTIISFVISFIPEANYVLLVKDLVSRAISANDAILIELLHYYPI